MRTKQSVNFTVHLVIILLSLAAVLFTRGRLAIGGDVIVVGLPKFK